MAGESIERYSFKKRKGASFQGARSLVQLQSNEDGDAASGAIQKDRRHIRSRADGVRDIQLEAVRERLRCCARQLASGNEPGISSNPVDDKCATKSRIVFKSEVRRSRRQRDRRVRPEYQREFL